MFATVAPANRVCPSADNPRIASVSELLAAMEAVAWREPRVLVVRGFDRVRRVHVAVPRVEAFWTADQARIAANALQSEQAFPGAAGVAAALRDAADAAERRNSLDGPLAPGQRRRPNGTGGRFILAALIIAVCVAAAWAFPIINQTGAGL